MSLTPKMQAVLKTLATSPDGAFGSELAASCSAGRAEIYTILSKLEEKRLVVSTEIGTHSPARYLYSLSPNAAMAHAIWTAQQERIALSREKHATPGEVFAVLGCALALFQVVAVLCIALMSTAKP